MAKGSLAAVALLLGLGLMAAKGQAAPVLFYSDLESGPNSGGQQGRGRS